VREGGVNGARSHAGGHQRGVKDGAEAVVTSLADVGRRPIGRTLPPRQCVTLFAPALSWPDGARRERAACYRGCEMADLDPAALRAYANRAWRRASALKGEHWARELAERGPLATFAVSQLLMAHMRRVRPDWPSERERDEDLAHHIALKRAIDLAARAFPRTHR
jgi:hypothetical protein